MHQQSGSILEFLQTRLPAFDYQTVPPESLGPRLGTFPAIAKGNTPIPESLAYVHRALSRSTQRHIVVAGESGIGKTTFLHAVGQSFAGAAGSSNRPSRAIYLNAENVGAEDSRALLETIEGLVVGPSTLLCIDGLMNLIRRPQGLDNYPMLRALVSRPEITLVASVAQEDLEQLTSDQQAMQKLFTFLELREPDSATLRAITEAHLHRLQGHHGGNVASGFLDHLLEASQLYQMNDAAPGRVITLLERCFENAAYDAAHATEPGEPELDEQTITMAIKELTGIDTARYKLNSENDSLKSLFSSVIFGQPEAARAMSREIEMYRSGLNDPTKPATVVLLAGTTGVGKTELAKAVSRFYSKSKKLNVFTMGNYTEPHSVSSVIGVPPGYVGHEEGGPIVNQLLADPFSVFLLDEAEKAHANVWKPFLNLFDEGWIVDQRGRKAVATNAIFMLTTNAGERVIRQLYQKEEPYDVIVDKVKEALLRYKTERGTQSIFSEQFLARINEIIVFRPLTSDAMQAITWSTLDQMAERWQQRLGISLSYSEPLSGQIAEYCYRRDKASNQREGGRVVRKTIRTALESRLMQEIREEGLTQTAPGQLEVTIHCDPDAEIESLQDLREAIRFEVSP